MCLAEEDKRLRAVATYSFLYGVQWALLVATLMHLDDQRLAIALLGWSVLFIFYSISRRNYLE